MINLLTETVDELKEHGKSAADVRWWGSQDGTFAAEWGDFERLANIKFDYNYGAQEIASDLVVVGDTWWLERHEYDGSEWWEFKTMPLKSLAPTPIEVLDVHTVGKIGWKTLAKLHDALKNKDGAS